MTLRSSATDVAPAEGGAIRHRISTARRRRHERELGGSRSAARGRPARARRRPSSPFGRAPSSASAAQDAVLGGRAHASESVSGARAMVDSQEPGSGCSAGRRPCRTRDRSAGFAKTLWKAAGWRTRSRRLGRAGASLTRSSARVQAMRAWPRQQVVLRVKRVGLVAVARRRGHAVLDDPQFARWRTSARSTGAKAARLVCRRRRRPGRPARKREAQDRTSPPARLRSTDGGAAAAQGCSPRRLHEQRHPGRVHELLEQRGVAALIARVEQVERPQAREVVVGHRSLGSGTCPRRERLQLRSSEASTTGTTSETGFGAHPLAGHATRFQLLIALSVGWRGRSSRHDPGEVAAPR